MGASGGADSTALVHMLAEKGFREVVLCHLNHRLRGKESAGDARFVKAMARRYGFGFEAGSADIGALMRAEGESLETVARAARHRFFAECARRRRCTRLLLAHHAEDQAETILWNLLRGSRGCRGMRMHQELVVGRTTLRIERPLLGWRRAELRGYLEERGLRWREDASNREPIAVRNRLRHEVFPLLEEISGRDPVAAVLRLAEDVAELEELERRCLKEEEVLDPQGRLHAGALRDLPVALRRLALREYLQREGVTGVDRALLEVGIGLLEEGAAASVNLPGGGRLRRKAGRLWVERPANSA